MSANKKAQTVFFCNECGFESPKWMGQCECGAWNSFVEERIESADPSVPPQALAGLSRAQQSSAMPSKSGTGAVASMGMRTGMRPGAAAQNAVSGARRPPRLSEVETVAAQRLDTGMSELNRVLGGGVVKGSLILISGEPGIGKSTLLIMTAANIAARYGNVLYVSGEESGEQIKMRADRVCNSAPENLYILSETCMEKIAEAVVSVSPSFIIVDSIQVMYTESLTSAPGSISQVRACAADLMRFGKETGVPIFIIAHVTKSGDLAGPRNVEHLVDCVLHFSGERTQDLRILRANKNRFGTTSEIGAFEMGEGGLIPIENLSRSFLEGMDTAAEGAIATAVYEGTRPLLLELQALTSPANPGFARRTTLGVENPRLALILAVLERRAGISLLAQDVYVNIVGGLKTEGTSPDLAVALAIFSSYRGILIDAGTLAIGEIGLTGELRSVRSADKIIGEAARLGFKRIILPIKNAERLAGSPANRSASGILEFNYSGLTLTGAATVKEAISAL